ncbi:hypothetical protein MHU86_2517 [Fragilaria crotonensis]|nr:hypothetical protein MHU86_2517 [Fragilaria crotonensis]
MSAIERSRNGSHPNAVVNYTDRRPTTQEPTDQPALRRTRLLRTSAVAGTHAFLPVRSARRHFVRQEWDGDHAPRRGEPNTRPMATVASASSSPYSSAHKTTINPLPGEDCAVVAETHAARKDRQQRKTTDNNCERVLLPVLFVHKNDNQPALARTVQLLQKKRTRQERINNNAMIGREASLNVLIQWR